MKKLLYLMVVGIGLFSACDKEEIVENTPYEKLEVADPKYSYVKILNLTPYTTPVAPVANYYLEGVKFSGALTSTGIESTGFTYNGLFPDFGYAAIAPGQHTLTGKIVPAAATDPNLEILNTTINTAASKYYSMFTTGIYSATSKKLASIITLEDVRPALDTSKVFIRFINLCNGAPNIDIVKGDVATGPKLITNVAYGTASNVWVEVPTPGNGTAPAVKFWFVNSTTGASLNTTALSYTLTKGRAYTIYSRGIFGTTATTTIPTYTFYTTFF